MMSAIRLDSTTCADFFAANKDAIIVLVFDAEFSGQKDLVDQTVKSLQETSELKDKIIIGLVDVEANNDLATKYSIQSVPMIACVNQEKVLRKIDSLDAKKVKAIVIETLNMLDLAKGLKGDEQCTDTKSVFREYLKKLTTRAPVMIFMKGQPQQPRCGFSRQLVDILSKHDIRYESFDILQDEDVRQGLKEYSDWPTYPQIYVKGEFIGGLDILKQLELSNELESTLKV